MGIFSSNNDIIQGGLFTIQLSCRKHEKTKTNYFR